MRGTEHSLNTQWPYVADVPPYRKMLLLFTGELRTRRYARFTPAFTPSAFTRLIDDVFDSKPLVPIINRRYQDAFFSSIPSIGFIMITFFSVLNEHDCKRTFVHYYIMDIDNDLLKIVLINIVKQTQDVFLLFYWIVKS